jgi:hypothetical protein
MRTCCMAFTTATLEPGRRGRCRSASRASSVFLGSSTMSRHPFRTACLIREPKTGWASVGFAPTRTIRSEWKTSSKGLVPAPVPSASPSP